MSTFQIVTPVRIKASCLKSRPGSAHLTVVVEDLNYSATAAEVANDFIVLQVAAKAVLGLQSKGCFFW